MLSFSRVMRLTFLLFATMCTATEALDVGVTPIRVELQPNRPSSSVRVINRTDARVIRLEAEAFRWERVNGEDKLEKTNDIIVNPIVAEIAPNRDQLIRIGFANPALARESNQETRYRVILTERKGRSDLVENAVNVAVRLSIPVFAAPKVSASQQDQVLLHVVEKTEAGIVIENRGARSVKVNEVHTVRSGSEPSVSLTRGAAYVLPAERRLLPWSDISATVGVQGEQFLLRTDLGDVRVRAGS